MKVVGYVRVSDAKLKEDGERRQDIDRQKIKITTFCEAMGWGVPEFYSDDALSAYKEDYNYVKTLAPYFQEASELIDRSKRQTNFTLHRTKRHIFEFLNKNHEVVNNLLDVVFPMGRVVKLYDPSQSQGIY